MKIRKNHGYRKFLKSGIKIVFFFLRKNITLVINYTIKREI